MVLFAFQSARSLQTHEVRDEGAQLGKVCCVRFPEHAHDRAYIRRSYLKEELEPSACEVAAIRHVDLWHISCSSMCLRW
jgi:hypothetical protein